jgi:hypothetical protein
MIDRAIDSNERVGICRWHLDPIDPTEHNQEQLCVAQIAIFAATIKGARMI